MVGCISDVMDMSLSRFWELVPWGCKELDMTERLNVYHSEIARDWWQEEKRTTEDEMAGWHH